MKTEEQFKKEINKKAEKVKTIEELNTLLKEVVNSRTMDYGKIVHAISGCMKATFNFLNNSRVGGITGFQANFIGWEMVHTFLLSNSEIGAKLLNYDDFLYPQFDYRFKNVISKTAWEKIQNKAKTLIKEAKEKKYKYVNDDVFNHWKSIVDGIVPFGYKVEG